MNGTFTPKHNLYRPVAGEQGWGGVVNDNFTILDTLLGDYKTPGFVQLGHLHQGVRELLEGAVQTGQTAGGDLTGAFPNPQLKDLGVTPGVYPHAKVTVNAKGQVTGIEAGAPDGGTPGAGAVGTVQLADGAVTTPKLADNAVSDAKLGQRTATPAAPTGFAANLTTWLGWITHSLQAITGRPFGQAPSTNIEELHTHAARKDAAENVGGAWTFQQALAVGNPVSDAHAVTLEYLRQQVSSIPTSAADNSINPAKLTEASRPYDVATFYPGRPGPSATALYWVAPRPTVLRAGNVGRAVSRGAAAAATTFPILTVVNNAQVQIGSVVFSAGTRFGAMSLTADVTIQAGQEVLILAPAVQDATLQDLSITLAGAYLP